MILGLHFVIEVEEADEEVLNDLEYLREVFLDCARLMETTVVDESWVRFSPQGVSGVVVIAESHLAIHTFPEHKYASVDIYTCNLKKDIDFVPEFIRERLKSKRVRHSLIMRGPSPKKENESI